MLFVTHFAVLAEFQAAEVHKPDIRAILLQFICILYEICGYALYFVRAFGVNDSYL